MMRRSCAECFHLRVKLPVRPTGEIDFDHVTEVWCRKNVVLPLARSTKKPRSIDDISRSPALVERATHCVFWEGEDDEISSS